MKKVKQVKGAKIMLLSVKEQSECGYAYAVVHPEDKDVTGITWEYCDWYTDTLEDAVQWCRDSY